LDVAAPKYGLFVALRIWLVSVSAASTISAPYPIWEAITVTATNTSSRFAIAGILLS